MKSTENVEERLKSLVRVGSLKPSNEVIIQAHIKTDMKIKCKNGRKIK